MKIKSILIALLLTGVTTLSAFTYQNCTGTENPPPPKNDGTITNSFLCYNTYDNPLYVYLTNLKNDPVVKSYANFKPTPRYGGSGKFVNGDYTVTGKSILKLTHNSNGVDFSDATYIKESGIRGFRQNVSKNKLYIPPKLEAKDIVFARAYWSGNIHSNRINGGSSDNNIYYAQRMLKGYRNMKISAPGLIDTPIELFSEDKDTHFSFSIDAADRGSLYFIYGASADITNFVKEIIRKDNEKTNPKNTNSIRAIDIAGGDIVASDGESSDRGLRWLNGTYLYDQVHIANFGSWTIVVVYNKSEKSYHELTNKDATSAEYQKYYKPKGVYIYDGFSTLLAPTDNVVRKAEAKFLIKDFYTPDSNNINAKLTTYAVSMANFGEGTSNTGPNYEGYVDFKNTKNNTEVHLEDARGNRYLTGIISIVKPGEENTEIFLPDNSETTTAISTYDVSKYMGKKVTQTYIKYGVSGLSGTGEQSFLNMVAFSTDLYVPSICYRHDVINMNNKINNFKTIEGENIRNIIKFENQSKQGEDADGVKVTVTFNDYMGYNKNTISINNEPGENITTQKVIASATNSPVLPKDMFYLKDNEKDAYITAHRLVKTNKQEYKDRKLNLIKAVTREKSNGSPYTTDEIEFYVGKNAGIVGSTNNIAGGSLKPTQNVYIDFNSTVGKFFKPLDFKLSFSYQPVPGAEPINVDYNNNIPECKGAEEKVIKVFPLDGLRVVNPNFDKNSNVDDEKFTNLHTQIADKNFKTKLIYRVNPEKQALDGRVERNADGNITHVWIIDERGREKKITKEEFDKLYTGLDLEGDLEISLITKETRNNIGCKNILDKDKIPFAFPGCPSNKIKTTEKGKEVEREISCEKPNLRYQVSLKNADDNILDLFKNNAGMNINYARQDYEFMVSYKPAGLKRSDSNETGTGSIGDDNPIFDALNKHNVINVCASDVFSVRPDHINLSAIVSNRIRVAGDANQTRDVLRSAFYPVNSKNEYVGGYNSRLGNLRDTNSTTNPVFLIPNLPAGCVAGPVVDPITGAVLWTQDGVPIRAEFLRYDTSARLLDTDYLTKEFKKYKEDAVDDNSFKLARTYGEIFTEENNITNVRAFNYYNIGDVNLSIVDTTWTKNDQGNSDDEKKGCIVGSASTNPADDPKNLGRIGCNISSDNNATLRFRHDSVDINVTALRDKINAGGQNYTYYDSNVSGSMIAILDVNSAAYLRDNAFHQNIIPTLYNSTCYARDVRFGLDFNFDCTIGTGVGTRCGVAGGPARVDLNEVCSTNIGDSRCYRDGNNARTGINGSIIFDGRGGVRSLVRADINATDTIPGAFANLNIVARNANAGFIDAQIPAFVAQRAGFDNGINRSNIAINFQRATNIPNNPIMLYAEDFVQNNGMNLREMALPTDINPDPITGLNTVGIISNNVIFTNYVRNVAIDGNITNPTRGVAYFYYGNVNAQQPLYTAREDSNIVASIASMVFCDDNGIGNCVAATNPFALLRNANLVRDNFYQNRSRTYNALNINVNFAQIYNSNDARINLVRGGVLDNTTRFFENLTINTAIGTAPLVTDINIFTNTWFIFDPANSAAIRNTFRIQFLPDVSQWGGEGTTTGGDNVGIFLDNNGKAINITPDQGEIRRTNRINW